MGREGLAASTQDFPHSHRAGYHSDRPSRPWALSSFPAVPFWVHTSLGLVEYPGPSGKRTQWCWPRLCSAERGSSRDGCDRQADTCGAGLLSFGLLRRKEKKRGNAYAEKGSRKVLIILFLLKALEIKQCLHTRHALPVSEIPVKLLHFNNQKG